jgi:hypothetical protein
LSKRSLRAILLSAIAAVAMSVGMTSSASASYSYRFCDKYVTGFSECWAGQNSVWYIYVNSDHSNDTVCARLYNSYYGWLYDHWGRQELCSSGNVYTVWDGLTGNPYAKIYPADGNQRHFWADATIG